jgi:hypothetical protein
LDDFDCASVCADVDPTHLEHLHERYDGARSDHKGVRVSATNLDGTVEGDFGELFSNALI